MDNGKTTIEQLRAIERWENEGGKVSRAVSIIPSIKTEMIRNVEIIMNAEPAAQKVIITKKRSWQNVDVWPRLRLAS